MRLRKEKSASSDHKSPVTVEARDDVLVLQSTFERVLTRCKKACPRHDQLLRNYINLVAEKGLVLHERIDCLLRPTIREKILTYLWRMSREQQKRTFTIPMNRNAMAEYLNVERSALSRELSYMKRDGVIDYHKNTFDCFKRITYLFHNQGLSTCDSLWLFICPVPCSFYKR